MAEVAGAVIATSLVLIAVFVPVAFISGTTGRLYRQFSLTIAFSVAISAFNALTPSPALAALLMRIPRETESRFFLFRSTEAWAPRAPTIETRCAGCWRVPSSPVSRFLASLALTLLVFRSVPSGFFPDEDQNYFIVQLLGPQGASIDYMAGIGTQVEHKLRERPEVQDTFSVIGYNFSGSTGGFTFELIDQGGSADFPALARAAQQLQGAAVSGGRIRGLFSIFSVDDPQLALSIDREKAKSSAVSITQINDAVETPIFPLPASWRRSSRARRCRSPACAITRERPRTSTSSTPNARRATPISPPPPRTTNVRCVWICWPRPASSPDADRDERIRAASAGWCAVSKGCHESVSGRCRLADRR